MEIIIILTVVSVIAAYLIFSKKKAVRPSLKKMSQEQKEKTWLRKMPKKSIRPCARKR
ncbi:hypothetical protein L1889_08095 [Paenalcaligenes niemegkensis]|uniref:hypothetical protein n=1 Tax=Paenalcaligenes niemegkensis TaxID=2895469 RepID=UPI001EE9A18F|nr:hypothetical protein [Paenalcaligenes niemegkensis]MCQ9616676.1 hypothetical protein [Paenalcaligenes niemegkensis]